MTKRRSAALAALLVFFGCAVQGCSRMRAPGSVSPSAFFRGGLGVSEDGRRLVRPDGTAFFWLADTALAQLGAGPDSRFQTQAWSARWIDHPETVPGTFGVYHFRHTFELRDRPSSFVVHVSADNRYRLFVNGTAVSEGPARGDLMHWPYETLDLVQHLVPGRNVVAAVVWNYGPQMPVAQHSHRTAFLLQGDGEAEAVVNTGPEWKVRANPAYAPIPITSAGVGGYYAAPPGEHLDASTYPWGWERLEHADDGWSPARSIQQARPHGVHPYGEAGLWMLVPRTIPPMEEAIDRFVRVARAEGITPTNGFLNGIDDLHVPARTRATLLLDRTHLTNAYPVLEASGGAGARVRLTYAEALFDSEGNKGNRNEIAGKTMKGYHDEFLLDGGARRLFRTLWFRTYRYVELEIETAGEPLRIHDLHGVFTGYPFEERARFSSDLPWLAEMWEINWRTARLNAWETYFDCPYYEQLQYIGDTRIQALISLYVAGDDRLMRSAIRQFDMSRSSDGITTSRYPSHLPQYIPPFSLFWVAMVHDHWLHREDPDFVRRFLPGIRGVLDWFARHVDESGMLGPMPWWNFADWAYTVAPFERGVPPGADDGNSSLITLQYVYALQRAAELEAALGSSQDAERYRTAADGAIAAVLERGWDEARGLVADSPERSVFSQHTNTMAVLVDAVPPELARTIMQRLVTDTTLVQAGYYYQFYVNEALARAGLADQYIDRLAPWREMLALGLTTVPETPEPTRSDAHAWSAHPNYGLLATVLGVRPAEPGFRSVRIAPALGSLRQAEGRIPHPRGDIEIRLARVSDGTIEGEIALPPGLSGVFVWGGTEVPLREGVQRVGRVR